VQQTKYLIVGSSHAGLEGLSAIRMQDVDGSLTLVTRDTHLPYSPTVLPYVVSGKSDPERILLRDKAFFEKHNVAYRTGDAVVAVDTDARVVTLQSGETFAYEKLLLATGASPAIPPIPGLDEVEYHVLRTLDDALNLRQAIGGARTAVALGAGLVGMAGVENLLKAGLEVTVVEMCDQVLPGYFDKQAADLIKRAFDAHGVRMLTGHTVTAAAPRKDGGCTITLDSGEEIETDLLLVGTGVRANLDYLEGSGIEVDRGILVDDTMRTNVENVWAAGDVVQVKDFYGSERIVSGILPNAAEQGRIAGMDMVGDAGLKPFPGAVPINTYTFFGKQAIAVGRTDTGNGAGAADVEQRLDEEGERYLKIVLEEDRLKGIAGINVELDAGIMWKLIVGRVDLAPVKQAFLARPTETGRKLMSNLWR